MSTFSQRFPPFAARMKAEGIPALFIETFATYYQQLLVGQTGLIPEADIEPVGDIPQADSLGPHLAAIGKQMLAKTAVIKLNGGLGTSMGLMQAKSLLAVKDGLTFLDIIARQMSATGTPLILMNSFATDAESISALDPYPALRSFGQIPLSFLQHKEPKINRHDLSPASWPDNPELEWCPPGHGDIYTALLTSQTLPTLRHAGYKYLFVANADNLGAVMDPLILGYFAQGEFPFMMEVAARTEMDKKGGHLAQRPDGQLILRESAQCPEEDIPTFQDINRHRYFNTNNLWLNLDALARHMANNNNQLGLPMIRNAKTVDPRDANSTPVYQLETAMGSAIASFAHSQALLVPRSRFAPVKKTDDLLAVRSDAYSVTAAYHVIPNPKRKHQRLIVDLDPSHYRFVNDLDKHFPLGTPSLVNCHSLKIEGPFEFGRDVICVDEVHLVNKSNEPIFIADGTVLTGVIRFEGKDGKRPFSQPGA